MTTTSPSTGTTPRRRTVVLGVLAALAVLGGGLGALAASHPENAPPPGGSVASGLARWHAADAAGAGGLVTANWVVLADGTPSGVSPRPGEGGGLIEGEPGLGINPQSIAGD